MHEAHNKKFKDKVDTLTMKRTQYQFSVAAQNMLLYCRLAVFCFILLHPC